ncbi:hypothetical protein KFL_002530010 [Klebsormidium nitens]|uniref:Uncharacterized protein n=1 Tax=Klebsormidium nitens TaxID=105231 RepID=A0A1Y1IAP1_KLENI|nr:hypothetical protein KFL_002530010 [Klebsormidium nitens]|eukprot:GAQ85756.1 hypothetical protein KFL_002530010 [Klebsormidium nitens]
MDAKAHHGEAVSEVERPHQSAIDMYHLAALPTKGAVTPGLGDDDVRLAGATLFGKPQGKELSGFQEPSPYEAALIPLKQANLHPIRLLFHLGASSIKMVFQSVSFWGLIAAHLLLLVFYYKVSNQHSKVDTATADGYPWPFIRSSTYAGYLGSLVSFCLVFQTTQSYNRFFQQYTACCEILSSSSAFAMGIRTHFPDGAFPDAAAVRTRLQKYLMAQLYLGFTWLPHYKANNLHEWAFGHVSKMGLLLPEEEGKLLALPHSAVLYLEIELLIEDLLFREFARGHISERSHDYLAQFKGSMMNNFDLIYNLAAMPVPFAFYQLLNVMAIGYLALLCYTYISLSYFYSLVPFALTALVTLGLRELSNALADPFGADETDIPILDKVAAFHGFCERVVAAEPSSFEFKPAK